jgi:hypothetical protein
VVFGGLALLWIIQGRVLNLPWSDLIRGELGGILIWIVLAPVVLSLGRRFRIDRMSPARFLAAHLAGMLLVFVPFWLIQRVVNVAWARFASGWSWSRLDALVPTRENVVGASLYVPIVYLLILLGAEALQHSRARREEELQATRLAGQLSEARLALLQRQLHPHFLFNALQAISTLLHRDPEKADRLLVRLSRLLRDMLEDASGQTLELRAELELTKKYLEIEEARFGDRLCVEWSVDEAQLDCQVPSLVVLPLVENAIRNGLSTKVGPGRLKISARSEGASLTLTVQDDGLGATLPLQPGVGIANTRARLEGMYGGRASLDVDTVPDDGFRARVRIPLPENRP